MEAYSGFAKSYDLFMDNVDYDAWAAYLHRILQRMHVPDAGTVVELGCGTGNLTERLCRMGYRMIASDISEEMLSVADQKKEEAGLDILYLQQDMRELDMPIGAAAVICACDGMNYILEEEELLDVFTGVRKTLADGGIFVFDMNTEAKFREIGESTIAENREEGSFIWENDYDEEQRLNCYALTLFLPEAETGLFRKYEEEHWQRAYEPEQIQRLLREAGFEQIEAWDAFTENPAEEGSERICFVAVRSNMQGVPQI